MKYILITITVVLIISSPTHDSWPFVKLNDWCGKWEDVEY